MKFIQSLFVVTMIQALVWQPIAFAQTKECGGECMPYFMFSKAMGGGGGDLQATAAGAATDSALNGGTPTMSCGGKTFPISYTQSGPKCEAIKLSETMVRIQTRVVAVFAAALATCTVVCAITATGIGAIVSGTVAAWVCPSASIVASTNDLYGVNELKREAKVQLAGMDALSTAAGVGTAVVSAGSALVAGINFAGTSATTYGGATGDSTGCYSAAALAIITSAKYASLSKAKKTITSNCKDIKQQVQQAAQTAGVNPAACGTNSSSSIAAPSFGMTGAGGSTGAKGARSGLKNGDIANAGNLDQSSMFDNDAIKQAATAGFKDGKTDDLKAAVDNAKQNGVDIDAIANKIEAGMSPSQAIGAAGIPGFNSDQLKKEMEVLKKMEDLAMSDQLMNSNSSVSGTAYAQAGGAKSAPLPKPMMPMGDKTPISGVEKKDEVNFNDTKKNELQQADLGDNVWHPYWTGNIFSLVSKRIEYSRYRVDQLEWATPANKMISGSNLSQPVPVYKAPPKAAAQQSGGATNPGGFVDPNQEIK